MTWLGIASALLKIAVYLFERYRDNALEQVGSDREKLKQLQALQAVSARLRETEERVAGMSDADIRKDLEKQGDFRD